MMTTRWAAAEQTQATQPLPEHVVHSKPDWKEASKGIEFCRFEITADKKTIETVAAVRIAPEFNKIRVFHSFDYEKTVAKTIEEWQKETSAIVMINGAQYMSDPYYMPCALVICDGLTKGPRANPQVRGMFVAEPKTSGVPRATILDFDYDHFDASTTPYTQGVQHWPILLDRNGKVKVKKSDLQANRTVVARDTDGNVLFFTTEGGFFTLYHFGQFLKDSNARPDRGFRIHTALNMDGGFEANMIVKSPALSYVTNRNPQTAGNSGAANLFNFKLRLPGVIGVFPRK